VNNVIVVLFCECCPQLTVMPKALNWLNWVDFHSVEPQWDDLRAHDWHNQVLVWFSVLLPFRTRYVTRCDRAVPFNSAPSLFVGKPTNSLRQCLLIIATYRRAPMPSLFSVRYLADAEKEQSHHHLQSPKVAVTTAALWINFPRRVNAVSLLFEMPFDVPPSNETMEVLRFMSNYCWMISWPSHSRRCHSLVIITNPITIITPLSFWVSKFWCHFMA